MRESIERILDQEDGEPRRQQSTLGVSRTEFQPQIAVTVEILVGAAIHTSSAEKPSLQQQDSDNSGGSQDTGGQTTKGGLKVGAVGEVQES